MMTIEEILAGESKNVEFKENLPEKSIKYMKSVVAFANGAGGKIIFGIADKMPDGASKVPDIINKMPDTTNKVPDSASKMSDNVQEQQIYKYVLENGFITTAKAVEVLGVKHRRARAVLLNMVEGDWLKKEGAARSTIYVRNTEER